MAEKKIRRRGRIPQTFIYLGKLFRMFIFQSDWKVLPMSAVIAGLVAFAVGSNLFVTMEGTSMGCFSMALVCIWNGFFNSIQTICRERAIVKREHRSGMHISSYIGAHMIYQAFLCILQSIIMIVVLKAMGVKLPVESLIIPYPMADLFVTLFLITYCADMLALMVSAFCHTTTTAMTIMPFLLIVELVFSGFMFKLPEETKFLTNLTATKWGMTSLCSLGDYNSLPMVSIWNSAVNMKDVEIDGKKPLLDALVYIEENDLRDEFMMETASQNQIPEYEFTAEIPYNCWLWLIFWTVIYIVIAVVSLEFIDRDKR
jgi:hypothetical protein